MLRIGWWLNELFPLPGFSLGLRGATLGLASRCVRRSNRLALSGVNSQNQPLMTHILVV